MNWETTFPPRDVQLEKLRREGQNKSTLRLRSGQAARACLRRELSRTLRVDPERRFLTPPSKAGLGAIEWVKDDKIPRDGKMG